MNEQRMLDLVIFKPHRKGLFRCKKTGKKLGAKSNGYRVVNFKCMSVKEHRLAFLYYNGYIIADLYVDHKDGNKRNNKRDNLRLCTHAENALNQKNDKGSVARQNDKWAVKIAGMNLGYYYDHRIAVDIANAYNELRCGEFKRHINYRDDE